MIVRNSLQCYPSSASVGFASQPGFACQTRLHDICDGCTETGPGDNVCSFLTLDEFHSTWTQGGFDLVVDVRSAEAYADGHIPRGDVNCALTACKAQKRPALNCIDTL